MAQEISWYRKYRPKTFADYEGDFVKAAVQRMSDPARRPQVILLHGVYGCGKTTAARLLAGFYLCESLTPHGTPCGKCAGCQQLLDLIERGEDDVSSESIQEINGSEANRIEDIRRIMHDSMLTLPSFSKYKIFIFDECHRITPEAQNALLKVLEDVPEHLVVIFATTEHDKMLPTILSRCQMVIEVKKQSVQGMVNILRKISKKEGLTVSAEALKLIARKGKRIPRDCINLLEDVAMTCDRRVTAETVLERLGEVDSEVYSKFIKAAHSGLPDILSFVHEFNEGDITYKSFLSGLSRYIIEAAYMRMGIGLDEFDDNAIEARKALFARYKVDEFHVLMKLVSEAIHRSSIEAHSPELAMTLLALNIGGIADLKKNTLAENVQAQAKLETSQGAQKFVERDTEKRIEEGAPKRGGDVSIDDFMARLGAVRCDD